MFIQLTDKKHFEGNVPSPLILNTLNIEQVEMYENQTMVNGIIVVETFDQVKKLLSQAQGVLELEKENV